MTFSVIILIFVLILSLIYFFGYKTIDRNFILQRIIQEHEILINNNFKPVRHQIRQNKYGGRNISHFKYTNGKAEYIINDEFEPPANMGNGYGKQRRKPDSTSAPDGIGGTERGGPPDDRGFRHEIRLSADAEKWIVSFAEGELSDSVFAERYKGEKYLFVISSIEGGYFFSYIQNRQDSTIILYMMVIVAAFILIGFIVAKIAAVAILKPINEFEAFTRRVAEKNFDIPIEVKGDDELSKLAVSLNSMQDSLKRAEEEEHTFLQSISHDLKTPIMVIMSHADAIIDGVYIETPQNTAQIIKDEAIRLSKKIKQLLYFNTLEYSLETQNTDTQIDMTAFIMQIITRFKAAGGDIQWESDLEQAVITADREKLSIAVENIIDNALRYAKSRISITLKNYDDKAVLGIYNDGSRISDDDMGRIFDNMYKGRTGKFGLGLAITKKIITHYGGSIRAENRDNGVCFIIELMK